MNHKLVLITLLFGISCLATAADKGTNGACELLRAEDLAPWGYGAHLHTDGQSATHAKEVVHAPSDVHSDFCSLRSEIADHRGITFVVVETFSNDIKAEDVAAWIKDSSLKEGEQDGKAKEIRIGDVTCETGEYGIPGSDAQSVIQYYVACDRLVGTRHLTVNVQQVESAKLPTPPQVKELLDQAAAHLVSPLPKPL